MWLWFLCRGPFQDLRDVLFQRPRVGARPPCRPAFAGAAIDGFHAVGAPARHATCCRADTQPRRSRRHPPGHHADRDSDHHPKHHRRTDRPDHQRHRFGRRAQVLSEPERAQALHRRPRPRRARHARFGHRQQRAFARVCRRCSAVETARQRCELHAALGLGQARRDRPCRRALRPVFGRVLGQLGRRGGRLHHAFAEGLRSAREAAGLHAAVPRLRHRRPLRRRHRQRLHRQPQRRLVVVGQREPARQHRPADRVREAAAFLRCRCQHRHAGDRRGGRPQPEEPGRADPRRHEPHPHRAGPRQAQTGVRLLASAAGLVHLRLLDQPGRPQGQQLSARCGRQHRVRHAEPQGQHRRARLHARGRRLRAESRHARTPGPRAEREEQLPRRARLGSHCACLRLRQRPSAFAVGHALSARRSAGRRRPNHRPEWHRLEHADAQGHVAPARPSGRAHRRSRPAARSLQAAHARLEHDRLARWRSRHALLGLQ